MLHFVYATLLACLSPITAEIFAAAMHSAAQEMSFEIVEISVVLFFLIMSCLHMFHGVLVAWLGQTLVAAYGLLVFTCSSFVMFRQSTYFITFRALQGIGTSACTVVGFTHFRTHLNPRIHIPRMNIVRGILLVVAPMTSEVMIHFGWNAAFLILVSIGIFEILLLLVLTRSPHTTSHINMIETDRKRFAAWVFSESFNFASTFLWISYAPFLQHVPYFGYFYGLTFTGSILGSMLSRFYQPVQGFLTGSSVMLINAVICLLSTEHIVIFTSMTFSNVGRGMAASHAQAQALVYGGKSSISSGILQSVRMIMTALTLFLNEILYTNQSTWILMIVFIVISMLIQVCVMGICVDDF